MMFVNSAISNLIREGRTANISQTIQTGMSQGMIPLERSIGDLLRGGVITAQTAAEYTAELNR